MARKGSKTDSGSASNLAWFALLHWQLGNDAEAAQWLTQALAIGGGDSDLLAALIYFDRGDIEASWTHAQRAAESDPWALFLLRDHYLRKGDFAKARARYAEAFPELLAKELPQFRDRNAYAAIDLALVLQHTGEGNRAMALLDRSEAYLRTVPRLGASGYGIADVAIHALRGDTANALASLREAQRAGWLGSWRYARDLDPNLASIRNEPEFKAVFADIERDMARQRAVLAARPKDAPLDLAATGK